jgi:NADH-quinone oxidoreductase subunit A
MNSISIVAYLALFVTVGVLFVFVNLLIGRFLRPRNPEPQKLEIYECGEPTIGSSFVQFDLRFYVVALLFLIFDVEVAMFFPWATVFGKATHLKDPAVHNQLAADQQGLVVSNIYQELGVPGAKRPDLPIDSGEIAQQANALAWFSLVDILVFFGVVLVGFAYVWMRGDIDWVRAVSKERAAQPLRTAGLAEPALAP